ncbi:AAA family ATPase [Staphylococcus hyicus]|uniref:AAA family ATPase n=2 Tax=Staphylococcus hyicus TaxID=1284 RepID=A0A418JLH9_STAHY|nr:AAA family ATPase [Staphylococcus hyicus]NJH99028.1 AAA family ATPase [Staphylococcus hyicus]NJI31322.1 AAA family ATPase [Staphylococcus hyicus]RIO47322.1 AAA family ATPase [Staphylococcus hyicus]RTX69906.1 AAA family ATPase [Staphylococcus hyicus]
MKMVQRIVIMGSPGTGKSTLAYRIAQHTGLPLYHMDALFWEGNQTTSEEALRTRLNHVISKDTWIIDGNYKDTLEMRIQRADLVIWLRAPKWKCIMRVIYRFVTDKFREKGPGANPDILEPSFIKHIWDFPNKSIPAMYDIHEKYKNHCRWIIV